MRVIIFWAILLAALGCCGSVSASRHSPVPNDTEIPQSRVMASEDKSGYDVLKLEILKKRKVLAVQYRNANSDKSRAEVISSAKDFLLEHIDGLADHWIGTPWDFNGTTETPNQGKIACGYFVTTILRDAGFNIPRQALAQKPSEQIIKDLIMDNHRIRRFSNTARDEFEGIVRECSDGVYIVGLDIHVGFIVKTGETIRFVHSSYYDPPLSVVRQTLDEDSPLTHSKYRVMANILDDPGTIRKWIMNEPFK